MRTYKQLSLDERYQIQTRVALGENAPSIAVALLRSPSTIYREIERNSKPSATFPYLAARAQASTRERRVRKGEGQRKIQGELRQVVEDKLRLGWSPDEISRRLNKEKRIRLSHETIYQHVIRDSKRLGFYRYCLRHGGYTHSRFKKSRVAEKTRSRKNWIHDRPVAANDRSEVGHWERDTIVGRRGGSALLTLVERVSRYTKVVHVASLESEVVSQATVQALAGLPLRSITNDNGREFCNEQSLQAKLGIKIYYCDPSSPWQRGTVENTNGLIRQYLKKGTDLDALSRVGPRALEDSLNHRPRKVLGYRTPHEVLFNQNHQLIGNDAMHFGLEFSWSS